MPLNGGEDQLPQSSWNPRTKSRLQVQRRQLHLPHIQPDLSTLTTVPMTGRCQHPQHPRAWGSWRNTSSSGPLFYKTHGWMWTLIRRPGRCLGSRSCLRASVGRSEGQRAGCRGHRGQEFRGWACWRSGPHTQVTWHQGPVSWKYLGRGRRAIWGSGTAPMYQPCISKIGTDPAFPSPGWGGGWGWRALTWANMPSVTSNPSQSLSKWFMTAFAFFH